MASGIAPGADSKSLSCSKLQDSPLPPSELARPLLFNLAPHRSKGTVTTPAFRLDPERSGPHKEWQLDGHEKASGEETQARRVQKVGRGQKGR